MKSQPPLYTVGLQKGQRIVMDMKARVANDFGFHPANDVTRPLHEQTRFLFKTLATWIVENTPATREQSLALTSLQEAAMWCNAAIAVNLAALEDTVG